MTSTECNNFECFDEIFQWTIEIAITHYDHMLHFLLPTTPRPARKPDFSFTSDATSTRKYSGFTPRPRLFRSSAVISPTSIRHCKYIFEKSLHGKWSPLFSFRHFKKIVIFGLHSPSWSRGKTPFSGGRVFTLLPPNASILVLRQEWVGVWVSRLVRDTKFFFHWPICRCSECSWSYPCVAPAVDSYCDFIEHWQVEFWFWPYCTYEGRTFVLMSGRPIRLMSSLTIFIFSCFANMHIILNTVESYSTCNSTCKKSTTHCGIPFRLNKISRRRGRTLSSRTFSFIGYTNKIQFENGLVLILDNNTIRKKNQ